MIEISSDRSTEFSASMALTNSSTPELISSWEFADTCVAPLMPLVFIKQWYREQKKSCLAINK
jgi:hypothetical protein